ncbi:hypothetical protein PVK06_045618 [Gossypium arboreum]|uniref:Uncharacterized protein n=1 Tax=Gossypium arboreum TaxID=29729 RepID=A0ABR0MUJ4_GOSAR|nr:hypothetical protein PVK06_045618 [Gossypium arboreum]
MSERTRIVFSTVPLAEVRASGLRVTELPRIPPFSLLARVGVRAVCQSCDLPRAHLFTLNSYIRKWSHESTMVGDFDGGEGSCSEFFYHHILDIVCSAILTRMMKMNVLGFGLKMVVFGKDGEDDAWGLRTERVVLECSWRLDFNRKSEPGVMRLLVGRW